MKTSGIEVLHLGGETHRMAGEVERLDLGHAATACEQAFPHLAGGATDSTQQAQAGDDDATALWLLLSCLTFIHCYLAAFWVFSM